MDPDRGSWSEHDVTGDSRPGIRLSRYPNLPLFGGSKIEPWTKDGYLKDDTSDPSRLLSRSLRRGIKLTQSWTSLFLIRVPPYDWGDTGVESQQALRLTDGPTGPVLIRTRSPTNNVPVCTSLPFCGFFYERSMYQS